MTVSPDLPMYSDFIVFVDESGDHGLVSIDPNYPLFVLAFCLMKKEDYRLRLVPRLLELKMDHFGHDGVILHEKDIRKGEGDFSLLNSLDRKETFMKKLSHIISEIPFFISYHVIDKRALTQSETPGHPYHLALEQCLLEIHRFLQKEKADQHPTMLLFEQRGKKEDGELKEEFKRIRREWIKERKGCPFEMVLVDKKANHLGLQLADLVVRPLGLSFLRPDQNNRTFEILGKKHIPLAPSEG